MQTSVTRATARSDAASMIASETGGAIASATFPALPASDRPTARRSGRTSDGTRVNADGRTMANPMPCSVRTTKRGTSGPSGAASPVAIISDAAPKDAHPRR